MPEKKPESSAAKPPLEESSEKAEEAKEAQEESSPRKLRLHAMHQAEGATFEVRRGSLLPWSYRASEDAPGTGDTAEDGSDLATAPTAGLLDLSDHGRVELVGADRQRFLGGLITAAVTDLAPSAGAYGFVTTIKGKVLADTVVSAFDDRLFLLLPPGRSGIVREHLSKYIVADRVEVLPLSDLLPIGLVGTAIESRLPRGAWPEFPFGCGMMELFGTEVPVTRHDRLGVPALVAWISSSIVESVVEEWRKRLELPLIGHQTMERLRVEQGLPLFGVDYDDNNLAQESGIEAVDFEKGCYLGQEIIARLHYRGQAPKIVRRLEWAEDGIQAPAEIKFEGRSAGTVTTVAGHVGLGMVQRRAAAPGTEVEVGEPAVMAVVDAFSEVSS